MTHMSIARQIRHRDWGSIKIFTLVILAILAVAIAARLITSSLNPDGNIGIVFSRDSFGFRLDGPRDDYYQVTSVWTLFCGLASFMSIALFIFGVITGSIFRSFLGSGATRTATWIANIVEMVSLVLTALIILTVLAGIFTLIDPDPTLTENSLTVWQSLPMAGVCYLAFTFGGYLIALLFVRFHWLVGVIAILTLVIGGPQLLNKFDLDGLLTLNAGTFGAPVVGLTWTFLAFLAILIALPIASTVPMRK